MRIKNVRIFANKFDEIVSLITAFDEPQNIITFENGVQLSYEKHSFLNRNNYLLVILILKHENETTMSFNCGGASTGIFFKFDWGTEIAAIDKILQEIELFLQANEINFEILDNAEVE